MLVSQSRFSNKWSTVFLEEVVDFLDSQRKPITEKDRVKGPYPYYGANGQQDSVSDFIFDEPLVLLAEDGGHFGDPNRTIAYQVSGKSWVNNHAHVLRPKKQIDIRYLCRHLERYDVTPFITGTTRGKLTKGAASRIPILLPPIAEQRRIAAILDRADAVRRKRQEAIALTEELLRSAFLEMFGKFIDSKTSELPEGWRRCIVNDLKADGRWACVGGPFGSNLTSQDYITAPGVPVIRGTNLSVDDCYMQEDDFVYVSEQKAEALLQNTAYPGDVIFTQRGTLGQVAMIRKDSRFMKYIVSQSQMKLTLDLTVVDPVWLVSYFRSPIPQNIIKKQTLATGVPHINLGIFKSFPVVLPPLEEQKRFSSLCAQLLEKQKVYKIYSSESNIFFVSLLQRAFRGEL